jgi:hypothetical protein
LIEGFETPYGMELLATVHWVATKGGPKHRQLAAGPEAAVVQIHAWNPRKKRVFKENHVFKAWSRLEIQGWFSPSTTSIAAAGSGHLFA